MGISWWSKEEDGLQLTEEEIGRIETRIEAYQKGLDDIVTVNKLFTIAVFVGLSFATPDQKSLDDREECNAETSFAKKLIVFEVIAFSWYLLSSLVAKTLKVDLNGFRGEAFVKRSREDQKSPPKIFLKTDRQVMLYVSMAASIFGCIFLLVSLVYVIQIRLGKISCRSSYAVGAAVWMVIIVSVAVIVYLSYGMSAIKRTMPLPESNPQSEEEEKETNDYIKVHLDALDDLVAVNSLFTLAVFVGLSFADKGKRSLEDQPGCVANVRVAKRLVVFEVVCFSWFLLSTMLANTMKLHLHVHRQNEYDQEIRRRRNLLSYLAGVTSVFGYLFLLLSIIDLIQVRLGKLSCLGAHSLGAALSLALIGGFAVFSYVLLMKRAIAKSSSSAKRRAADKAKCQT